MRIISHRGYWKTPAERNTATAFRRALSHGFGIETDLRDFGRQLVISHDSPDSSAMPFETFLDLYQRFGHGETLALNVKADGLQERALTALTELSIKEYFFFDMSVPDALEYKRRELRFFSRHSEIEPQPALYDAAVGVWMDCFFDDWIRPEDVRAHLAAGKEVCICSPELHGRNPENFLNQLADTELPDEPFLALCTDEPEKARNRFTGGN
ncbi:MAG: hypothetical protein LBP68_03815 [Acidobacteriota bacterium]|jgi:hypothetical protein|nr:hypothetical protein [Acidobacteriota bacterium]